MTTGPAPRGDDSTTPGAGLDVDPDFDPPFVIHEPDMLRSCVVLSSPHSGRTYPARFLACARLDPLSLRRSEDAFVDRLVAEAVGHGMPLICARFPRAYLDVNREPYELDPRMFEGRLPPFVNSRSVRVAGGLGTIARVVGEAQEIYARRLTVEEGIRRIDQLYRPYHAALQSLTERAQRQFGLAVLVDCHSMPSTSAAGSAHEDKLKADMVIGDRYGTSCHPDISATLEEVLSLAGYTVARNKPYAGGFITEHYGRPAAGCHAVQIEVNRALYMDERLIRPSSSFGQVADDLAAALGHLARAVAPGRTGEAVAAE